MTKPDPMWIFLNDKFVTREDAVVSVFDHGFLYGDGVYETLRAYGGRLCMLPQHLARLQRSARLIGLDIPIPEKDWPALLGDALARNRLSDAYLRITVSRGTGEIGLDPGLCPTPTVVVVAQPFRAYPAHLYTQGVSLITTSVHRNLATALSPQIKSLNFLNNILAKQEALKAGAFDGIMLNAEGHLAECTTSNIFFVRHGTLCTPSVACGILDGITRDVVLTLAKEQGLKTEESAYTPEALRQADECFLTNTTMELLPVRDVDRRPIGAGKPGPVTRSLHEAFRASLDRFLA